MNPCRFELTHERLLEVLSYDPNTGLFRWNTQMSSRACVGDVAGNVNELTGYRIIGVDKVSYPAQRLAYLYMTGSYPPMHMDHINRKRDDNRWVNLRPVSPTENHRNRSKHKSCTSGFTGVYWNKQSNKWHAQIRVNYKTVSLGMHESMLDACAARFRANKKYGFDKTHGF